MPEPFKNLYNPQLIKAMAASLARVDNGFNSTQFVSQACDGLEDLEMMARAEQISTALEVGFSGSYLETLRSMIASLHPTKTAELKDMQTDDLGIAGWAIVPLASFVARRGMEHPEQSLDALREMTMRFSTEFAVRYFLRDHPDLSFEFVTEWARDENAHVRRLASEGTRPLLPWGIKLHHFVEDPSPMLPILLALRDDPSDYVRKSVANHLNDISKNHPDLVANIAADWLKDAPVSRQKLVKHACRGLIKKGHPAALRAFGYSKPDLSDVILEIPQLVRLGETLPISFSFKSNNDQRLLIDYVLHFMRANGRLSPKVFKWTELHVSGGNVVTLDKIHPYKRVTTRKDYPGKQVLSVQVNGLEVARRDFQFDL